MQHYYQYQVVLKPAPANILELYLGSLEALGFDLKKNDVRFAEDEKVDLIITQKVSNVSKKQSEITFCARILAAHQVGIYFISEDIFTLASYYQEDLKDPFFYPSPDWQLLPDDDLELRGMLHD